MNHDLELCVHCRRPFAIRFNGVGFYFHWVKNYYFVDVVFFVKNCPLVKLLIHLSYNHTHVLRM